MAQNFMGGVGVAFGVSFIVAIADGLSTFVFDGATLSSKIKGSMGGKA
jgi:hypothetical protein